MKHVDEYRDPQTCRQLVNEIRRTATRGHTLMEVCGGQTHGLLMHGIDRELEGIVELLHGPGCPVCVTAAEDIDFAISLCQRAGVTVVTFGDMLRVPGTSISLREARSRGGDVRLVYLAAGCRAAGKGRSGSRVCVFLRRFRDNDTGDRIGRSASCEARPEEFLHDCRACPSAARDGSDHGFRRLSSGKPSWQPDMFARSAATRRTKTLYDAIACPSLLPVSNQLIC